ncbi:MAG: class I SAM-dependent methyltransferase [Deltaproteobacteria bacterium]|jgi:2-polyprenyl-3-methyl-5-hydroxy-6-metoxy-1,4-benzoquinol methylase|nr:class I SAM-dependent methyltransferase [Deltaproteobacteria bacterium]
MTDKSKNNLIIQSSEVVKYNSLIKNSKMHELKELYLFDSLTKIIDSNVKITSNSTILELGFNEGTRLKKIASYYKDSKVIGIEVRQSCVDKLVNEGYDCRLVNEEIFEINEKFDVIYGYLMVHHLSIPYDYLKHLYSLLKPGGILFFPNESYSTHIIGIILNTITGNWKYETNMFKLSRRKLIKECHKISNNFYIGYNGLLILYGFPKLNKIYRTLNLHKLPFFNDLSIFIKKDSNI